MILEPPAAFDHPYTGPVVEWVVPAPEADRICRVGGLKAYGEQIIGCSFKIGETCYIVLARHAQAVLRKHETAHCNGWRHK